MDKVLILLVMVLCNGLCWNATATNHSRRPEFVNLGALFSFNTTVGKIVKIALQTAVDDVNSDTSILNQTKLNLSMQEDSKYKGFLSIAEALELMEKDTVAIIGPQTSITAHVISHIANELQVPLVSFSASDPTLSSLQYPFFVRFVHSDIYQMSAIADMVEYYGWREVVAIYVDDDHGRGGISALGDKLAEKRCKISFKAPMSPSANQVEITDVLVKVALQESRILVVHTNTFYGPQIVRVARSLGMLGTGNVWIATYWLSAVLDTDSPLPADDMEDIQGILTLRVYTPESELKRKFVSRWRNLTRGQAADGPLGLSTFGLYAYDTVWFLARGLETFFNQGNSITFSNDSKLANLEGDNLHLDTLKIFNEGKLFLNSILGVNMTGVAGQIEYTVDRNLVHPAYEIINVIGTGSRRIGYWSNYSGLSVQLPETFYSKPPNQSRAHQQLQDVIWPGQTTQKPRGWVFPNTGRLLQIGVPIRISFRDFVSQVEGTDNFKGYCIDVFIAAVQLLPYAVPYRFVPFGDGHNNPSHTELVRLITTGTLDAAVGDITITNNRTKMADFTQPFIESGLVVVAPVHKGHSDVFAFLRPFTPMMWCVTAISFLVVGAVVWVLEHRLNDEFRGPPRKQIITILWFSFSTMFFAHRENTVSTLGRSVVIIWLFVVLIINSSYTASLTSILTVQKLSSPIKGIETLKYSKDPIGYQQGSFTANYLIAEYGIEESRLVPLKTTEETAKALADGPQRGGVAAYVDERAYMELFLSSHCEFSIVGQEFTKSGWGFAFQPDSPLALDLSTAILKLSETGDLQRIHDKWLFRSACTLQGAKLEVDRLELKSFLGLYSLCGLACLIALLVYLVLMLRQFRKHGPDPDETDSSTGPSVRSRRLQTFLSFVNQKEEEAKAQSKRRKMESTSNKSIVDADSVNGSIHRFPDTLSNKSIHGANEV